MKLNQKKHFIIGSYPGVIYFSWLAVILFVALIFFYESTNGINPFTYIFGAFFVIGLFYTYLFSYVKKISDYEFEIKLPFKKKFIVPTSQVTVTQPNNFVSTWVLNLENSLSYKLYFSKGTV